MDKKKKITGGDLLVKALLAENVQFVFGIPGGQLLAVYDAVNRWGREYGIDTIMFRHEQAAAHAADAYARVTNTPGVCMGTVGPGATHLVPGVGASWSDNIPVIAIVPQVQSRLDDSYTLQGNLDQITMFKPITKYQKSIHELRKMPDAVQKVFREATGGRPGPVLLEVYEDTFLAKIEEDKIPIIEPNRYRASGKPAADSDSINNALDILLNAEKPLIISGGGVMRAGAWNELKEFAEYLQIPVITTIMGIGTISSNSKTFIGSTIGRSNTQKAARESDVVLCLGCKWSFSMLHGMQPVWGESQKVIQVDIDPAIIGRNRPVFQGIVADCKIFLKQMIDAVKKKERVKTREYLDELAESYRQLGARALEKAGKKDKIPIAPQRMVHDILEFMDEDAILILDGGDITVYTHEQIDFHKPRPPLSTLASVGMGHLGTSVPFGIGAKLAKPDKQVISISGDGSFMINIQDLETAVRLGLKNLIYVIGNNGAWGMIKSGQKYMLRKRYIDVDFPEFNFAEVAKAFGCYGEIVTEPQELIPALNRAKNSNKPAVIDVKIKFDTPETTKLLASLGAL